MASMNHRRRAPAAAYTDGSIVVFGGTGSSEAPTTAERYELSTGTWHLIAAPSGTARPGVMAATTGPGHVLVLGGAGAATGRRLMCVPARRSRASTPLQLTWAPVPPWATIRCLMVATTAVGRNVTSATSAIKLQGQEARRQNVELAAPLS